jgi:hypothetical protein
VLAQILLYLLYLIANFTKPRSVVQRPDTGMLVAYERNDSELGKVVLLVDLRDGVQDGGVAGVGVKEGVII